MRTGSVQVGPNTVRVWIVETAPEAVLGLGYVDSLGDGQGMLFPSSVVGATPVFVFDRVRIPLDLVWVKNGRVVAVATAAGVGMTPLQYYDSVDFALEIAGGFVQSRNVRAGDPVSVAKY